jgi:ferredoxin
MRYLDRSAFARLLPALVEAGYDLVGPTVRDGAIVLDRIDGVDDLPRGVREVQDRGTYRLERTDDERLFDWAHGPDSGKRFLFPPREVVGRTRRVDGHVVVEPPEDGQRPLAFVGLRSCDLHAIAIQDRVFRIGEPAYRARREASVFISFRTGDPMYRVRGESALFIGVNCAVPGATCFCASMGTGPRCTTGFDLALTELAEGFVVDVATLRGEEVLARVGTREPTGDELEAAERVTREAAERVGRELDASDMPAVLYRNRQHPRWKDVAARCLACGNCTSVCPTCFCHDLVDDVSVSGDETSRTREWASCFSEEYSWAAGAVVRQSREARYRQWLTHKFASWIDQFGTSGCVGCGRCITWCPVGIDVTEEVAAIRATDGEVEMVVS